MAVRARELRSAASRKCTKDSHNSSRECDPAHLTAPRRFETPVASTPFTPTGAPSRLRPDFDFDSPVNQSMPTESTRNNIDLRNIDPRNIDPRTTVPVLIEPGPLLRFSSILVSARSSVGARVTSTRVNSA